MKWRKVCKRSRVCPLRQRACLLRLQPYPKQERERPLQRHPPLRRQPRLPSSLEPLPRRSPMRIWSRNSRKCSKVELVTLACMIGSLLSLSAVNAAIKKPQPSTAVITSLKSDLASRKGVVFDRLLQRWERQYGSQAVEPLLSI